MTEEMRIRSESGFRELCVLLAQTEDVDFLQDFLTCLLTKAEMYDLANRWLLVKEIDKGTTQRDIAQEFNMSLCKITRGSRELKKENSAFKKMLEIQKKS